MAFKKREKTSIWERTVEIEESKVRVRTYRCPVCDEVLFRVPYDLPVPQKKIIMECKNGDKVRVPEYDESQMV